jgi:hypothetical protein
MGNTPHPIERSIAMQELSSNDIETYVTVEPIMEFHLDHLLRAIKRCNPTQVNIGADSGNNHLPEPSKEKVLELIDALSGFTAVKNKPNLNRILK